MCDQRFILVKVTYLLYLFAVKERQSIRNIESCLAVCNSSAALVKDKKLYIVEFLEPPAAAVNEKEHFLIERLGVVNIRAKFIDINSFVFVLTFGFLFLLYCGRRRSSFLYFCILYLRRDR